MKLIEKKDNELILKVYEHECRFLLEADSGILNYGISVKKGSSRYKKQQLCEFSDRMLSFVEKYENDMPYFANEAYYNPVGEEAFEIFMTVEDLLMVNCMIQALLKHMPESVMQSYTGYQEEHILRFQKNLEQIASEAGIALAIQD